MRIFVKVKEGDRVHLTVSPQSGVVRSVYFENRLVDGFYYTLGTWTPRGKLYPVRSCQFISLYQWLHPVSADTVCDILYQ